MHRIKPDATIQSMCGRAETHSRLKCLLQGVAEIAEFLRAKLRGSNCGTVTVGTCVTVPLC